MSFSIFTKLAPDMARVLDPWEERDIADVLEAAREWKDGRLPLAEFAKIGMIRDSAAYTRYLAMLKSSPAEREALRDAVEALIVARPDLKITSDGIVSRWDLLEAGMPV